MSDLIDREAAIAYTRRSLGRWSHLPGIVYAAVDITNTIKALPAAVPDTERYPLMTVAGAAVPVVDVEKAAREYKRTYMRLATEETANEIHERALEAAILSAGCVGTVDAGDLRRAALYLEAENTPESRELAKRLLAAIEGK